MRQGPHTLDQVDTEETSSIITMLVRVAYRGRSATSRRFYSPVINTLVEKAKNKCQTIMIRVGTLATLCVGGLGFYMTIRPSTVQFIDDVSKAVDWTGILPTAIDASTVDCALKEGSYVNRPALEVKIKGSQTTTPNGRYTIVYGPKGVGKSAVVHHEAANRTGVVLVNVTSNHDKASLTRQVIKVLLGPNVDSATVDETTLAAAITKCTSKVVTIIFDVERAPSDGSDECLRAVRSLAKCLADHCRCIIVLSEANTVVEFGRDPRENFVFVGEFTTEEARELLRKKNCALSYAEMTKVFDKVGTSPTVLQELVEQLESGSTSESFISEKVAEADGDLVEFPLKPILSALKENQDGVPLKSFETVVYKGVELSSSRQVAKVMKTYPNPIIFDMKQRKYILMSRAHHTALASYEPIISGQTGQTTAPKSESA